MDFFRQGVLLLVLAAAVSVHADMKVDCGPDYVSLVWTESRPQVDPSLFRLGDCPPTAVSAWEAVFTVDVNDCKFSRLVTGDQLVYSNDLMYVAPPGSPVPSFIKPVVCVYERPNDWFPVAYEPVFFSYSEGDLVFHMGLMNEEFSGPAQSSSFSLGSLIPIMASVEQNAHQPLLLLLEECVAATTQELQSESNLYTIITNKGCLVDSKTSRSRFETRRKTSEILLSLQAFRFAVGEEVFIHCKLVAWDPAGLDTTKKACHFVEGYGWELLDNQEYNSLCDCCESSCRSRKTRSVASGTHGISKMAVLGPIMITEGNSEAS